jgi:hypothetical protein
MRISNGRNEFDS